MRHNDSRSSNALVGQTGPAACGRLAADPATFVAHLIRGDAAAGDCLVVAYRPRLNRVIRRYLRNQADVDEAVQDTFLQAFRALPRFRGQSGLYTWLYRIAVNRALMTIRDRRRRPEVPAAEVEPWMARLVSASPSGESSAIRGQALDRLRVAVAGLPPRYREVVAMLHDGERGVAEIADRLGISTNAVKIRALRARRALKVALGPQFANGDRQPHHRGQRFARSE